MGYFKREETVFENPAKFNLVSLDFDCDQAYLMRISFARSCVSNIQNLDSK